MNIELRKITKDTVRQVCALEVRDDQKIYVAANALSIAQAHFEQSAVFPGSLSSHKDIHRHHAHLLARW
jgi:hypothetical protein